MSGVAIAAFAEPSGEGWKQVGELAVALGLSSLIGFERELRARSAGLRTHALVGVAAALVMLVSKYGFSDVAGSRVILDPSRVAAQIVSGIGFIGAGLIFVRHDAVRGLTTAATIWLTAAVGMAAGAALPILACLVTAAHFIVVYAFTPLVHRVERLREGVSRPSILRVNYRDREGILRKLLALCTREGFTVNELTTEQLADAETLGAVAVRLVVSGKSPVSALVADLSEIPGVLGVRAGDPEEEGEP